MKLYLMIFLNCSLYGAINVVTTIPDYASLAQEVGGKRVNSVALIKGTQDPHYAEAKPSYLIKLNRADLMVFTGLGLESGWLPALLNNARNSKIQPGNPGYIDASQYVHLQEIPTHIDRSMGDIHAGGNPHFYTSPVALFAIAQEISKRLITLDPEGRVYYQKQWKKFQKKYDQKMGEWQQIIKQLTGKKVVVYHKSWVYFLNWSGLIEVGSLEPKPGIPPTPRHLISLLKQIRGQRVQWLIQEPYHSRNLSQVFTRKGKMKLLILPSMVGGVSKVKSIWSKFDFILKQFK